VKGQGFHQSVNDFLSKWDDNLMRGMYGGHRDKVELIKKRAIGFLDVARYSLDKGNYDIAAFSAEQVAQLYLKATLLELMDDFPRTHSIIFFLKELARVKKREVNDFLQKNKRGLHNLEDAYLTSRYFYKIFDRDDGEFLISLAEEVINFCEKLGRSVGKG
jgi:HEPN domain-containing protein